MYQYIYTRVVWGTEEEGERKKEWERDGGKEVKQVLHRAEATVSRSAI